MDKSCQVYDSSYCRCTREDRSASWIDKSVITNGQLQRLNQSMELAQGRFAGVLFKVWLIKGRSSNMEVQVMFHIYVTQRVWFLFMVPWTYDVSYRHIPGRFCHVQRPVASRRSHLVSVSTMCRLFSRKPMDNHRSSWTHPRKKYQFLLRRHMPLGLFLCWKMEDGRKCAEMCNAHMYTNVL